MNQEHLISARILWDYHNQSEPLGKADLIVGLGSYDLRVAVRCVELQARSFASKICFTGASGNWTSGLYKTSEAAAFAARAAELGAPSDSIYLEEKAQNIGENIALTLSIFPKLSRAIWVTKPQTQRRLRATLQEQFPELDSIVTAPDHGFDAQPTTTHTMRDLICELVGDTWRIEAYPALGFMAKQEMPDQVHDAFASLVEAGFTDHVPTDV